MKQCWINTWRVHTIKHNGTSAAYHQGLVSLAAKQSAGGPFSQKSGALACKSCEQRASSFVSAMAWWQPWELNVFFWSHPLESGCLGEVQGVVGAPAALCRYTSLRFHAQTHQNGPVRLLSPGTRCCSAGGLKLFMKHFHSQRCAQWQLVRHFPQQGWT